MTTIHAQLSSVELEARYEAAADPVAKSHFHALWLVSCGYEIEEVAELLSFSSRWVAGYKTNAQWARKVCEIRPIMRQIWPFLIITGAVSLYVML